MIDILKTNKAQNYQLKINVLRWGGIFRRGVLFSRKSSPWREISFRKYTPGGNIFWENLPPRGGGGGGDIFGRKIYHYTSIYLQSHLSDLSSSNRLLVGENQFAVFGLLE